MKRDEIIGCIAEMSNGKKGFIIPLHGTKTLVVIGKSIERFIDFDYNGDAVLKCAGIPSYNIIKIYKLASLKLRDFGNVFTDASILDYITGDSTSKAIIYKDKSIKTEMTLAEIEKALGHKVKIIS